MKLNFKTFINEQQEARIKSIGSSWPKKKTSEPEIEFLKKMYAECSDTINYSHRTDMFIHRGDDLGSSMYYIGNQYNGAPRKSANTRNYYTYILDNSKEWAKYPLRSRSFIGATSEDIASGFGEVHYYFPVNGSKIGQCPGSDLWNSFTAIALKNRQDLSDFNYNLSLLFEKFAPEFKSFDNTAEEYFQILEIVDNAYKKLGHDTFIKQTQHLPGPFSQAVDIHIVEMLTSGIEKFGSLRKTLEDYLSPTKNKFKLFTTKNLDLAYNKEVWTDGICYIVHPNYWGKACKVWFGENK